MGEIREREQAAEVLFPQPAWAVIDLGDAIEAAVRHLVDNPHMGRLGLSRGRDRLLNEDDRRLADQQPRQRPAVRRRARNGPPQRARPVQRDFS